MNVVESNLPMEDRITRSSVGTYSVGTSSSELSFNYNAVKGICGGPGICCETNILRLKPTINFNIKKVIFNNPATIIYWEDGSKTVVQAHDEPFDPEKGLAMAIAKRAYGNKGNFNNIFKKYIKE